MSTPGYLWYYVSSSGVGPIYTFYLRAYQTSPNPTMIAVLIQSSGGVQPPVQLTSFQVCPGTQVYSPPGVNGATYTISWDGNATGNGAVPSITSSQGGAWTPVPSQSTSFTGTLPSPSTYLPANCTSPSPNVPITSVTYQWNASPLTIYMFNSVDTNQPLGYVMSTTPPTPLYIGGYTNPASLPNIYILWSGALGIAPGVTVVTGSGSTLACTPLTGTITNSSAAPSTLPNAGNSVGAISPIQAPSPQCPLPTLTGTQFTYNVVNTNDLKIITYSGAPSSSTNPTGTGAFVLSYPGVSVAGINLCNGNINPYPGLFIGWDGKGLTASSITVVYNCTALVPFIQQLAGFTASNIPSGVGTCTTNQSNCGGGGNGGGGSGGGGGGGGSNPPPSRDWIWWTVGIIVALIIVGIIITIVIVLRNKHGSLEAPTPIPAATPQTQPFLTPQAAILQYYM